ncbi:MAG: hypothetical protein RIG82_10360 [Phycisphaeraceae bacterium]
MSRTATPIDGRGGAGARLAGVGVGGWRERVMVWCGVVMVGVVLLPGLVPTFVNPWLETDPRVEGLTGALGGMTGTVAVGVQLVGMIAAGVGLVLARGVRGWWLLLAGVGCLGAMWSVLNGAGSTGNRVMVGSWVAGAVMAVGMASLVSDRRAGAAVRRWVVAVLVGGLIPLAVDALWQVYVEHPENLRFYERTMDEMLAARGWAEGSPEHLLFARRMSFADATGGYALSNVLGSVGAGLACLGLGFVGTRLRDRGTLTAAGVLGVGGVLVWLTASRGAMGALMLGVVWFGVACWLGARIRRGWLRGLVVGGLGLLMVLLPWVAIGWAGAQGPPPPPPPGEVTSFPGWLSLLFRYWYLEAGLRMLVEVPGVWWSAVGPEGFALMFGWMKDPMLPEDVASTHNVVVDLLVMLGVYGLCWLVLGGWWLWRGMCPSRAADVESGGEEERHVGGEPNWLGGMAASGVLLLPVVWMTVETLYLETAFLQLLVFAGMAVAVAWLAELGKGVSARVMGMGLAAGALVLMVHGQMEMTFFNGGASQLAWVVLGLAGGVGAGVNVRPFKLSGKRFRDVVGGLGFLGLGSSVAAYLVWVGLVVVSSERLSLEAARLVVAGESLRAADLLEKESGLFTLLEKDRSPFAEWIFRLRMEEAHRASAQGDSTRALELSGLANPVWLPSRSVLVLWNELGWLDEERMPGTAAELRRQIAVWMFFSEKLPDETHRDMWLDVKAEMENLLTIVPYSVRDRLRLVEVLIELEDWDEAAAELERARGIHAGLYLDPLKQLPEERFEGLAGRIEAGRAGEE